METYMAEEIKPSDVAKTYIATDGKTAYMADTKGDLVFPADLEGKKGPVVQQEKFEFAEPQMKLNFGAPRIAKDTTHTGFAARLKSVAQRILGRGPAGPAPQA